MYSIFPLAGCFLIIYYLIKMMTITLNQLFSKALGDVRVFGRPGGAVISTGPPLIRAGGCGDSKTWGGGVVGSK